MHFAIPLAKEPSKLPLILSRHDIRQLIAAAESLRDRTLLQVTYNAGLRASEVVHLKIAHIDSRRMCLRIIQGKRQKDREALLSPVSCRTCGPIGASIARPAGSFPVAMAPSRSPAKPPP